MSAKSTEITDEQLAKAEQELKIERKILGILRKVADPVKRARIMRAVAAFYGLDEH